uniref:Uncharacterized protein n=1 Tax=Anguilla anguilla TaxID=7936 RepID=A0A0E9SLJ4_ANGAN
MEPKSFSITCGHIIC